MTDHKSRGRLIARCFRMIHLMTSGEWVTFQDVCDECSVNKKTAYRWLDAMEMAGYMVETCNDRGSRTVFRLSRREHGIQGSKGSV